MKLSTCLERSSQLRVYKYRKEHPDLIDCFDPESDSNNDIARALNGSADPKLVTGDRQTGFQSSII